MSWPIGLRQTNAIRDRRDIEQFTDAELTAILRKRVKVVPIESDEQRPADEPLN